MNLKKMGNYFKENMNFMIYTEEKTRRYFS